MSTKRHSDALARWSGACNPSGIANAIVRAQREILAEPGKGTVAVTSDPAVRLMVSQLAYLCGVWDGVSDPARFSCGEAADQCEAAGANNSIPTDDAVMNHFAAQQEEERS